MFRPTFKRAEIFIGERSQQQAEDAARPFQPDAKFRQSGGSLQLETQHLDLFIGNQHILKDVNVQIPRNKITCIVGPSGCGKSTLLKTFNRLTDSIEGLRIKGRVLLGEHDILHCGGPELIELRRLVGLVPQRPCPLPMSVFDNVAYGCRIHGIRGRKQLQTIVEHYLREVGLWEEVRDRLRQPASRLSVGQQQRLCLARSLAVEPEYILADEATSALDPVSSNTIEQLFVRLKKNYSIVMVTHTLRQALRIADYVIFVYMGEIIEAGDARQVFHEPQHELTRNYLSGVFS